MNAKRPRSARSWLLALLAVSLAGCAAHAATTGTTAKNVKTTSQAGCVNFDYVEKAIKVSLPRHHLEQGQEGDRHLGRHRVDRDNPQGQ